MTTRKPKTKVHHLFGKLHRQNQWRPPTYPATDDPSWLSEFSLAESDLARSNMANAWFWRLNQESAVLLDKERTPWLAPRSKQYSTFAPHADKLLLKQSFFDGNLTVPETGDRLLMKDVLKRQLTAWPFYLRLPYLLHDPAVPRTEFLVELLASYRGDVENNRYRYFLGILQHMCWDEVEKQGPDINPDLLRTAIGVSVECGLTHSTRAYSHKHPLSQAWESIAALASSNKAPPGGAASVTALRQTLLGTPGVMYVQCFKRLLVLARSTNTQKEVGLQANTVFNLGRTFNKDMFSVLREWLPEGAWTVHETLGLDYMAALEHAAAALENTENVQLPANLRPCSPDNDTTY